MTGPTCSSQAPARRGGYWRRPFNQKLSRVIHARSRAILRRPKSARSRPAAMSASNAEILAGIVTSRRRRADAVVRWVCAYHEDLIVNSRLHTQCVPQGLPEIGIYNFRRRLLIRSIDKVLHQSSASPKPLPNRTPAAPCRTLPDRVKTAASARTTAVSIRLDVLSEFSEPGNSVYEDLLNAVTLDNVSELISGAFRCGC